MTTLLIFCLTTPCNLDHQSKQQSIIYGRSCLERWLKQSGKNVGKCPQCSKKFRRKEIVNLYAPVIAVPNADLEKVASVSTLQDLFIHDRNVLLKEINKQKISLLSQHLSKIELPPNISAIKDLRILSNGLPLLASLGKKLLLYSMASNNLALKYDLPAPAWSCCGDKSNSHNVYAGLQNGMLLVFDIRQTSEPMQLIEGLTSHPVHFVVSVVLNDGSGRIFSASSSSPCVWEVGFNSRRPFLIPEMQNRGVCISLACCGSSDTAVATFRPKFGLLDDIIWVDY
ncbi:uncharacterized protein LOC122040358 [Zingiber officinale]|uniref:uncharacterized protein LOC122040358 n=1 Tax=Zingiber officinale TaxID=94328 RepID=UPI001C4DB1AA|nr:uncharacterized protein LOC122040358 [Zingiber officinale]